MPEGDETRGRVTLGFARRREPEPPPVPERTALEEEIRDEIRSQGPMTFARFMELALYHPVRGYYSVDAVRGTRAGDFLTAPETHPLFGSALAGQMEEMWRALECPREFVLREYGAGSGELALAILARLRERRSALLEHLVYEPVEAAGRELDLVPRRLARDGFGGFARTPGTAPLVGCILANELLDALPVHRVVQRGAQLRELFVALVDDRLAEQEGELSKEEIADALRSSDVSLIDGQRAEVSLETPRWIRGAAQALERGYLLLIDYGHPAPVLYSRRRHAGTLRAYRSHRTSTDPFAAVGLQDITAHVDLTAVARAATHEGLVPLGHTTQAEFLVGAGLGDLLGQIRDDPATSWIEYATARSAVARFLDPGAMGGFAVLLFGRGVPRDRPLSGFRFRLPEPLRRH